MITSLFRKSTPLNYSLVVLGMLLFFGGYYIYSTNPSFHNTSYGLILLSLVLLYAALFISNFIAKKNSLSKDSAYTVLFYVFLMAVFPSIFSQPKLLCAQFFILLSTRRLVSLHTMKASKEKLFDAALWVFIASLFYFWSILFLVLVYISILFHTARDYRTWFLPVLAFVAVAFLYLLCAYLWNPSWVDDLQRQACYSTKFEITFSKIPDLVLLCYTAIGVLATLALMVTLANKPLLLHSSYKKIISAFVIGIAVYVFAPLKTNELMVFTATPLAIIYTSHIESIQSKWQKELFLLGFLFAGLTAYFYQL